MNSQHKAFQMGFAAAVDIANKQRHTHIQQGYWRAVKQIIATIEELHERDDVSYDSVMGRLMDIEMDLEEAERDE